jgi:hypothetical protein
MEALRASTAFSPRCLDDHRRDNDRDQAERASISARPCAVSHNAALIAGGVSPGSPEVATCTERPHLQFAGAGTPHMSAFGTADTATVFRDVHF